MADRTAHTDRFQELDGFRAIAALAVVLSHYTVAYDSRYPNDAPPLFFFGEGGYGVQLFFLISGFVILMTAQRARRPSDFAISRVTRLYPAYWVALAISVVLIVAFDIPGAPRDLRTVALNATMIQRWLMVPNVDDVYWTLALEMQFYVLVFTLLVFTRCHLTTRVLDIAASCWLATSFGISVWAFPYSHGLDPQLVDTTTKIILNIVIAEYAPLFVGGAFLFLSRRNGRVHWMVYVAFALSAVNTFLLRDVQHAIVVPLIYLTFAIVALRESTRVLRLPPLQWLGKISYSLYITHTHIGFVIIDLMIPYVGRNLSMLSALVVTVFVAWVVWMVAENRLSPAWRRSWLRRRDRVRPTP